MVNQIYSEQWERMCEDHPDVPTGSTNAYQNWEVVDPEKWVSDGYVVIRVDSRGAGRSEGELDLWSRKEAEDLASRLDGKTFVVIRSASETGALYGSVTPRDAAEAATSGGFNVERKQIALIKPIKELPKSRLRAIIRKLTRILSAIGSRIDPISDSKSYFLAK